MERPAEVVECTIAERRGLTVTGARVGNYFTADSLREGT